MNGYLNYKDELYHYGVIGMRWGVRRYQPYGKGGYEPIKVHGKKSEIKTAIRNYKEKRDISKKIKNANKRNRIEKKYTKESYNIRRRGVQEIELRNKVSNAIGNDSFISKRLKRKENAIKYGYEKAAKIIEDMGKEKLNAFDNPDYSKSRKYIETAKIFSKQKRLSNIISTVKVAELYSNDYYKNEMNELYKNKLNN